MAESGIKGYFPSQVVSDLEKISYDYGLKVAKGIEREWFNSESGSYDGRFKNNINDFHKLRLYARGEQPIQKYKDELSINGESILKDMRLKELNDYSKQAFGINLYENNEELIPDNEDELKLHMQLSYKQAVELAEEQAINVLLEGSRYELIKKRLNYDLTVLGIAAVKTSFNTSEGAVVEYVDPANLVYSHTDSPYFDDIYYVGEVKAIPVNELVK